MGNLSFLIPTEKKGEFIFKKVTRLLYERFNELKIDATSKYKEITFYYKEVHVCNLYFEQPCYLIDYELDKEVLEQSDKNELSLDLDKLQKMDPDLSKTISMTYGNYGVHEYREEIMRFLHSYFKLYVFDEGIHPEYIPPNYQFK